MNDQRQQETLTLPRPLSASECIPRVCPQPAARPLCNPRRARESDHTAPISDQHAIHVVDESRDANLRRSRLHV
jgi:hypothetical protein